MRILHTADWHLGKKLGAFSRMEEQERVLKEITNIAITHEVDTVLVAGDLYDNFNPSNEAMQLFFRSLKNLAQESMVPVLAIAGNHDSPDRINVADILARENGILLFGNPLDVMPTFTLEHRFQISRTDQGFVELKLPHIDFPLRVILTAYANELRLKQDLGENKQSSLQDTLTEHWDTLADKYCDQNGVNILMTHLFIQKRGGETLKEPDGERILNIGNADLVYSDSIPGNIQYTALGHLHRYQDVGIHQPVIYSGSPLAYSFAEAGQKKYVAIVDIEPGKEPKIERVPLQSGKPLERVKFDNTDAAIQWLQNNPYALIELTMLSDDFLTAEEIQAINAAHDGIVEFIPQVLNDKIIAGNTAEIDLGQSIEELFELYFMSKNKGQKPNEELMRLFQEIKNIR